MNNTTNYIGQLRIYSLVDLMLLFIAAKASYTQMLGGLVLHVSFLAFLESWHAHPGRAKVPRILTPVLAILGVCLYAQVEAVLFLVAGFFYTKKNHRRWGQYSSLFRGMQYLFLLGGIVGYGDSLTWAAFFLLFFRNVAGDARDVVKDEKEGMRTLPILFGARSDWKNLHLLFTIGTTIVWWRQA